MPYFTIIAGHTSCDRIQQFRQYLNGLTPLMKIGVCFTTYQQPDDDDEKNDLKMK